MNASCAFIKLLNIREQARRMLRAGARTLAGYGQVLMVLTSASTAQQAQAYHAALPVLRLIGVTGYNGRDSAEFLARCCLCTLRHAVHATR